MALIVDSPLSKLRKEAAAKQRVGTKGTEAADNITDHVLTDLQFPNFEAETW